MAKDKEAFNAMLQTYNQTCQNESWKQFYSGYRNFKDGWHDVIDRNTLDQSRWKKGFPEGMAGNFFSGKILPRKI